MQQRAEIARALINQPRVIFMDEPFAALDAQTRFMMQELLLGVWGRVGTTVVFVTHDIDEAIFLGDRVFVMTRRPGRIREVIPVAFPRPRSVELTTTAAFVALKRRCLDLVREETMLAPGPHPGPDARCLDVTERSAPPGPAEKPRLVYSADHRRGPVPDPRVVDASPDRSM